MDDPSFPTASWGRRVLALAVDWLAATLVTVAFVGAHDYFVGHQGQLVPLVVYVVESATFTWLLGGSFGKLCTGLRVLPSEGPRRPLNPVVLLVRQLLVALVVPPLVFRPDGRGLHDLMAHTATVTRETFDAAARPRAQPNRAGR